MQCDFRELKFSKSNESIKSPVEALKICNNDSAFCICGSGDQSFAILEKANKVLSVDNNKYQINYGNFRKYLLRKKDYSLFGNYFSGRLDKISEKVDSLEFRVDDFFGIDVDFRDFNKFYLSNVLTYKANLLLCENLESDFISRIEKGSLVYVADSSIKEYLEYFGLIVVKDLTALAKEYNFSYWDPIVFEKK